MSGSPRKHLDLPIQPSVAFGRAVREARQEAGLTQEELCAQAGLTQSYLSSIEQGRGNPTLHLIWVLSQGLDQSPGAILSRTETIIDQQK